MTRQLSAMGYEVVPEDGTLRFVNRFTWSRNYQAAIFLCCAALLGILGLLVSEGVITRAAVSASFLFSFAAGLAVYSIVVRILLSPKRAKGAETPAEVLVVNAVSGELQTREGEAISPLDEVHVEHRIDWWGTWGLVSYVRLSWDGGNRIVFRALGRRKAAQVMDALQQRGVGS